MFCDKISAVTFILKRSHRLRSDTVKQAAATTNFRRQKFNQSTQVSEKFTKLVIWGGNSNRQTIRTRRAVEKSPLYEPNVPSNWTKFWPTAHSSTSFVPFPIRQGHVKNINENSGLVPNRSANTELMKIPNFLHLTPLHIKKHCKALKPFLTTWPPGLKSSEDIQRHYPIEVISQEFVFSSPSMRDERARSVTLRIPLKVLRLKTKELDKLRALVGPDRLKRNDNGKEMLVLTSDRCPTRKQNYNYLTYVLTVLTTESKKSHDWDQERTEKDWNVFYWTGSSSEKTMKKLLQSIPGDKQALNRYKDAVKHLWESKENVEQVEEYKESVKQLLGLQNADS